VSDPHSDSSQPDVIGVRRGMFGAAGSGDTSGYGRLVRPVTLPGSSPRPYGGYFDEVVDALAAALGDEVFAAAVERVVVYRGELTLEVHRDRLPAVAQTLRNDPALRFELCLGVSGVHYPDETGRELHAVYHLLSITHNHRLRLKAFCSSDERPIVDSVNDVWSSADWFEREAFDLYGILFRGHPDLRRLLTDYGFIGHPFRKDFPLIGNVEMRYDPAKGRVVYEPVSIEPRTLVPRVIRDDARYDPDLNAKDPGSA